MAALGSLLPMTVRLANSSTGGKGAYSGKEDKLLNTTQAKCFALNSQETRVLVLHTWYSELYRTDTHHIYIICN